MKIDPVTFEVDVSAGTHPLYVWEAPVRVWPELGFRLFSFISKY